LTWLSRLDAWSASVDASDWTEAGMLPWPMAASCPSSKNSCWSRDSACDTTPLAWVMRLATWVRADPDAPPAPLPCAVSCPSRKYSP
jgi:hypothetical protein